MKDLKFLRTPESNKIATALYWGSEQVSDRVLVQSSQLDFCEKALIAWTVKNHIETMMRMAPFEALYMLHVASEIWNYLHMVEYFTPQRINKLRIAFEAADGETEQKLHEHLNLVQVCVAYYNHFQRKVA